MAEVDKSKVLVKYRADQAEGEFAGGTVADVRQSLQKAWDIPVDNAARKLDIMVTTASRRVNADYIPKRNETVVAQIAVSSSHVTIGKSLQKILKKFFKGDKKVGPSVRTSYVVQKTKPVKDNYVLKDGDTLQFFQTGRTVACREC